MSSYQLKVVPGKGRGKDLGIPTINLEIPQTLELAYGVYAGRIINNGKKYKTAIHFGPRPVYNEIDPSLEAYILDGTVTNLAQTVTLEFVKFIREIKMFPTPADMVKRIDQDILEINSVLKSE